MAVATGVESKFFFVGRARRDDRFFDLARDEAVASAGVVHHGFLNLVAIYWLSWTTGMWAP